MARTQRAGRLAIFGRCGPNTAVSGRHIVRYRRASGGATPEAAYLDRCRAAGVGRALLALPPEGRDKVMPAIDEYATFLE